MCVEWGPSFGIAVGIVICSRRGSERDVPTCDRTSASGLSDFAAHLSFSQSCPAACPASCLSVRSQYHLTKSIPRIMAISENHVAMIGPPRDPRSAAFACRGPFNQ